MERREGIIPILVEPLVIPRADHTISRQQIDPDALKVLYRLRKFNHVAYLVGGGVRDLLLDRHPKDFDLGTSARPQEVKRLFRNCWIIGRRFRLAHVKFGPKTIEVATFRRQVPPDAATVHPRAATPGAAGTDAPQAPERRPIRRDNTFGTAEEDAFRRDFTINALFYDIATFSIIDYVDGVADLRKGIIRAIGDPNERFIEDPVRMLRAISLAVRLDFRLDDRVRRAIGRHKSEIAQAAPARMIEELYKILRSGVAATTFQALSKIGLLKHIAPEVDTRDSQLGQSLCALDDYRTRFKDAPPALTKPILLGSLVVPAQPIDLTPHRKADTYDAGVSLGALPLAQKDVERLRQLLQLQTRLVNAQLPPRAREAVIHRGAFDDAMTWLEIHGADPESLARWRAMVAGAGTAGRATKRRRRRPRRRRPHRAGPARS